MGHYVPEVVYPKFAVPRDSAHATIRQMVRIAFGPSKWEDAEREIDAFFESGQVAGYVEGDCTGYDAHPPYMRWHPYETSPEFLLVDVTSFRFPARVEGIVRIEPLMGRKAQPFDLGFETERQVHSPEHLEAVLLRSLGRIEPIQQALRTQKITQFYSNLFGSYLAGGPEPDFYSWKAANLTEAETEQLRRAYDYVCDRLKSHPVISQIQPDRTSITEGAAALLQAGGRCGEAEAESLAYRLLRQFPREYRWPTERFMHLVIEAGEDLLLLDYCRSSRVKDGLPMIEPVVSVVWSKAVLDPNAAHPWVTGIYSRQVALFDRLDALRVAIGLQPDPHYEFYRQNAVRD